MKKLFALPGLMAALFALPAWAQEQLPILGRPEADGIGFQTPATELMEDIVWLDNFLLITITAICLFVVGLLGWVIIRYNARRNPEPAKFTHNTPLEVTWTVVPAFILVVIGVFSLPILFKQQIIPEADVTIKATGYQWYWGYEYVDHDIAFESYMIGAPALGGDNSLTPETEAQLVAAGYSRDEFLLATDTAVVVPVGKTVVMQVTAADVIHAWTIPAFGVKQDGVPGRLAELWFNAKKEGVFFGQCSELCGLNHAYMPITVKVVSEASYDAWLKANQEANGDYVDVSAVLTN